MKVTVWIPEEEIKEAILQTIVKNAAEEIDESLSKSYGTYYKKVYIDAIKTSVRDLIKSRTDELCSKAVDAASVTIANKGMKELIERWKEDARRAN